MTEDEKQNMELIPSPTGSPKLKTISFSLLGIGGILCLGALFSEEGRHHLSFGWLWGFSTIWSIVLGALFLVAVCHLTHATWSVVLRRVAEMVASCMGFVAVLFVPLIIFLLLNSQFHLYEWADQAHVEGDSILQGKQAYLNTPFFLLRGLLFFALWIGFTKLYVSHSLKQDSATLPESTRKMRNVSAPFMPLFAFTATFAGIDWLMSLDPHWFSTIIGVYMFSGLGLSSLATVSIAVILLRKSGRLGEGVVTDDHLYNLSLLIFVFANFWAYIAFSQYMLIWYGNIPEETYYIAERMEGGWQGITIALYLLRWIIPFFALLARRAKRNASVLFGVSIVVLIGQMVDMYWVVMPELYTAGPSLHWHEIGPSILMAGTLLLGVGRFLAKHPIVAMGDPFFQESRKFHLQG
jgi:hypothetical protein